MNEKDKNKKPAEKKKRTLLQKIVNVFLYTGLGLLVLILIILGISQTSTFREFLRETVLEEANSALNGKVYIERIDGTIFTSLMLRNTVVTIDDDTLLNAENIGVLTSPLQLLLKRIHIRHIEIQNADINLIEEQSGDFNFTRLFSPSEDADTTSSEFPFLIQVANLQFENVNFSLKNYSVEVSSVQEELNINDLSVNNLNLNLNAELNISKNIYELSLEHLSFKTNVKDLDVNELRGEFYIDEKNIIAHNFYLETNRSEVSINASAVNVNIFDTSGIHLENADLKLEAGSGRFSINDVTAISPSLNLLGGEIEFDLNASGTLNALNLNTLEVSLDNSKISGNGKLRDLLKNDLLIDADLSGSYVNQSDVKNLLPGIEVPLYPEYGVIRFDTLTYQGSPSKFSSRLNILTDRGSIGGNIFINLENELIQYDVNLITNKIDIEPVAGTKSSLNISTNIKGAGITPETFDGSVRLFANGSSINGNFIDTLRLTADADKQFINYEFRLVSKETTADLSGNFDFAPEEPTYILNGDVNHLNLEDFTADTTLRSNLNLSLDAEGDGFEQDNLDLFLTATLFESTFGDVEIDTTQMIVDLRSDPDNRVINIISDLADITVMGNFKVADAVDLIVSEMNLVSNAFNNKMNNLFPQPGGSEPETGAGLKRREALFTQVSEIVSFDYLIDLKDFSLVSAFIGNYNLDVDAEMSGHLENTAEDSVQFTFYTDLRYVKFYNNEEAYFISNLLLNLEVDNSYKAVSTADLELQLDVTAERILAGSEIHNLFFNIGMENDSAELYISAESDPYNVKLITGLDLSRNKLDLVIDSLKLAYRDFILENHDNLVLSYNGDRLDIDKFRLVHENSEINIEGHISQSADQELDINLHNWRGKDLSSAFMDIKPENSVEASINLDAKINGTFPSPEINAELVIDSITYGNKKFGKLLSLFSYNNKNMDINLAFLDSTLSKNDTAMTINGFVPIDLSFAGAEENYMSSKPMDITLNAESFNLGAFGDILPAVNKLRGEFNSDLNITGTPSDLNTKGFVKIENAAFFLEANNLEYNLSLFVDIDNEKLRVDSLVIANTAGTENGGRMNGSGSATLDNFNITSSEFSLGGDLKVLSEDSKGGGLGIYGDLVIATDGDVELNMDEKQIFLSAPVIIRDADLTFPQTKSAYQSGSENYIYRFAADTAVTDTIREMDLDDLVEIAEKKPESEEETDSKTTEFNYTIDVTIDEEATITYVLSREFDQNLVAILEGNITLRKTGNKQEALGKFTLLEGSTLQFIKTLETEGSIDFPSGEISNPYLDLVAIYSNYHYPTEGVYEGEEVPVEVRLYIEGPLEDLDENLSTAEDNIEVFYGAKNIADNNASADKDASDAIMFILRNEFIGDNPQRNQDEVANLASSVAGSLLGNFLNNQFGDAVKSVQLRQVGTSTVVSLMGRAGKFRYEIGTSTDVYQDLSRANVKIQYPVTKNFFIRVERKESINRESTYINEMVNEVGLKYLFEF